MKLAARCIDGTLEPVDSSELDLNVSVCAIVVRDGRVLVMPMFDGYDFPGGGVEMGETHIAALKREVKEETGFDVEPDGLLDAYTTFFKSHRSGKFFHSVALIYFARIVGGELSSNGFTKAEREYMKNPQFVDVDYLKPKRFLRYVDDWLGLVRAIENRLAKGPDNPAGTNDLAPPLGTGASGGDAGRRAA